MTDYLSTCYVITTMSDFFCINDNRTFAKWIINAKKAKFRSGPLLLSIQKGRRSVWGFGMRAFFGRLVNSIPIKGEGYYAHHMTLSPPIFWHSDSPFQYLPITITSEHTQKASNSMNYWIIEKWSPSKKF